MRETVPCARRERLARFMFMGTSGRQYETSVKFSQGTFATQPMPGRRGHEQRGSSYSDFGDRERLTGGEKSNAFAVNFLKFGVLLNRA